MVTNRIITALHSSKATSKTRHRRIVPEDVEPGLRYYLNSALVPQEHVLRKGFPYKPDYLVSSEAVLTADGSYVAERTYPWEAIFTDSHTRFIAQENTYEPGANRWYPLYTEGVDYSFTWSGLIEPRLEEIDYRIGKQLYTNNSVRISEGSSLVSSFNNGMDDAATFIIAIAGIINSSEKASLIRVGDTMADAIEVTVDEYFYLRNQYGTSQMKITTHPSRMIPFYALLINDSSKTELRIATGTSRIQRTSIPNRSAARSLKVSVGRDIVGNQTLDMNLFELTLFPYARGGAMTPEQIINAMADVYGSVT